MRGMGGERRFDAWEAKHGIPERRQVKLLIAVMASD
jgi:hypothetical protein